MSKHRLDFGCCFCGKGGADTGVAQTDMQTGEFVQQWFAHKDCLREALHESARIFKDEDDEEDTP